MLRSRLLFGSLALVAVSTLSVAAIRPVALFGQDMRPKQTEQHKQVQKSAGTWEGTLTMSMPGMDEPIETPAMEVIESLGDYWTTSRFECDFMGMPFIGVGNHGYDPQKEAFVGTWIDNMGTSIAMMEGNIDKDSGKLIMHWKGPDMSDPTSTVDMRHEMLWTDDSYTMEFFKGKTGGEPTMVISMHRKAGGGQ